MAHRPVPWPAQALDLRFRPRPWPAELPVKKLNPLNPRSRNRLQVRRDPLRRHVPANEVEPGLRAENWGRLTKSRGILITEGVLQGFGFGNNRRRRALGNVCWRKRHRQHHHDH